MTQSPTQRIPIPVVWGVRSSGSSSLLETPSALESVQTVSSFYHLVFSMCLLNIVLTLKSSQKGTLKRRLLNPRGPSTLSEGDVFDTVKKRCQKGSVVPSEVRYDWIRRENAC